MPRPNISVLFVYTILKTISPHFQLTRTSRGPSAIAELLVHSCNVLSVAKHHSFERCGQIVAFDSSKDQRFSAAVIMAIVNNVISVVFSRKLN